MSLPLRLYGYWRSGAAYRVRIALALKGLAYDQANLDLRIEGHRSVTYRDVAPQGLVPALEVGEGVLTQSLAIMEWLEERFPMPPLLPVAPLERAIVRAMAECVACDIHPLNNLRVLTALRADFAASRDQIDSWVARWIGEGFAALEVMIGRHGGAFAFGDAPTLADCCLVPQVYSARRFGLDLKVFPNIRRADEHARALAQFAAADPSRQPDADSA
ncbi:MAG TPA: maleylacetoacetate isomerase [Caulobacteraceae bacterium]